MRALPLVFLALATPAFASPPRLAVVEPEAPPELIGLSAQLTRAVLAAAAAQKLTAVPPQALHAQLGEAYEDLRGCGQRMACLLQRLPRATADRVVVGTFHRNANSYLVKLWLVDLASQQVVSTIDRSILIASRRLLPDVEAALPAFLQGQGEVLGTLVVSSDVEGARVTVDGQTRGAVPITVQLKPGKHEVKLEKAHHLPVTRLVTVEPNQQTEEKVRLLAEPGAPPPGPSIEVLPPGKG